jgi:hypothetical protein
MRKFSESERTRIWFSNEIEGELNERSFMRKDALLSEVVLKSAYKEKLAIDSEKPQRFIEAVSIHSFRLPQFLFVASTGFSWIRQFVNHCKYIANE